MNIIIRKVRVLAAPFVGTEFFIELPEGDTVWGICQFYCGEGATVDWGDGTVETYTESPAKPVHEYARAGAYRVRVDDRAQMIRVSGADYSPLYATYLTRFVMNSPATQTITTAAFRNCTGLRSFDIGASGVKTVTRLAFSNCTSLAGDVYLPHVNTIGGNASQMIFAGCSGITKIHFSKDCEEAITQSTTYKIDPTLGTGTAVCVFDL